MNEVTNKLLTFADGKVFTKLTKKVGFQALVLYEKSFSISRPKNSLTFIPRAKVHKELVKYL